MNVGSLLLISGLALLVAAAGGWFAPRLDGATIDWAALELKLEGAGFKDGGCVIAQLENEIVGKAAASPGRAAHAKAGTRAHEGLFPVA